jgi:hypothetical protein
MPITDPMSGSAETVIGRSRIALAEAARPSDATTDQALRDRHQQHDKTRIFKKPVEMAKVAEAIGNSAGQA